jgi:hypothetical protein
MIISRCFVPIMRQFSDKSFRESLNTHFIFDNFLSETRAVFEMIIKSTVEPDRPQMII